MLCDDRLFWHEHFKRPPLDVHINVSGGEYEVMEDDGTVVTKTFDPEPMYRLTQKMMRDVYNQKSQIWEAFKEKR
jgi:hypothetical protein